MGTQVALCCELAEWLVLRKSTSGLVELGESHSVEEADARHVRKRRSLKGEGEGQGASSSQEG